MFPHGTHAAVQRSERRGGMRQTLCISSSWALAVTASMLVYIHTFYYSSSAYIDIRRRRIAFWRKAVQKKLLVQGVYSYTAIAFCSAKTVHFLSSLNVSRQLVKAGR